MKNNLKNKNLEKPKRYLLKGGIIGVIVDLILLTIGLAYDYLFVRGFGVGKTNIFYFVFIKEIWEKSLLQFFGLQWIINFFVLGAFIGWIYGKIIQKREER